MSTTFLYGGVMIIQVLLTDAVQTVRTSINAQYLFCCYLNIIICNRFCLLKKKFQYGFLQ